MKIKLEVGRELQALADSKNRSNKFKTVMLHEKTDCMSPLRHPL